MRACPTPAARGACGAPGCLPGLLGCRRCALRDKAGGAAGRSGACNRGRCAQVSRLAHYGACFQLPTCLLLKQGLRVLPAFIRPSIEPHLSMHACACSLVMPALGNFPRAVDFSDDNCTTCALAARPNFSAPLFVRPTACWRCSARADALAPEVTDRVFMDLTVGGKPAGRIILGLYGKDVPRTAANFKALGASPRPSPVRSSVPGCWP